MNAAEALRPLRYEVSNFYLFEDEVRTALTSILEKHCVSQSSLKRAKMLQIPVSAVLEGEVKTWHSNIVSNIDKACVLYFNRIQSGVQLRQGKNFKSAECTMLEQLIITNSLKYTPFSRVLITYMLTKRCSQIH